MPGSKPAHLLLLGALTVLPGCLAVNAALGVFGIMGPPAAQLAGAAYTVAEYSYEYGAHDRTPDEVFLAKFDWLLDDRDEPGQAAPAGTLNAAATGPRTGDAPRPAVAVADAAQAAEPIAVVRAKRAVVPVIKATPVKAERKAAPATTARGRTQVAKPPAEPAVREPVQAPPPRGPVHVYADHPPDPLLARLDRLENGLAQAEALYLSESKDGLRLSVPPCDGDPCAQGVNGGHSLRLPVMRTVPGAPPAREEDRPQSAPPSIRSLNT